MKNKISQAIILCGGKGERLRPITKKIPKPLAIIGGETILGHQLKYLKNQGITDFILATGYKSELIEEYVDNYFNNLNIKIIDSGDVDIMIRLKKCTPYITNDCLICYGDTLANVDINALYNFHIKNNSKITVTSYQLESQFGILDIDSKGLVFRFREKPKLDAWINIGYIIININTLQNKLDSFKDFISSLADKGCLFSYKHHGLHITVNSLTELKQAEKNIINFT
tara:strand:- start:1940 stop:2620 length:681 start_codon:yes stop_codon:yes gene_type:complete